MCIRDRLESENITVREGAQHYWSLPLGGGRAAALVNTMDKYGINENPKLYPVSYTHLDVYKRQALKRPR